MSLLPHSESKLIQDPPASLNLKRKRAPWELNGISSVVLERMVGSGTFGLVFKASERETGDMVALKKIKIEPNSNQGFPITAIREIRILKSLKHENIIALREIIVYKPEDESEEHKSNELFGTGGLTVGDIFMVFEYCFGDLSGLLKTKEVDITNDHVKSYMKQLLSGLHHLHIKKILHRDIKSANILVTRNNVVKIADWGLARTYLDTSKQDFTNPVVTLWYRSPELLLGCRRYGSEVDIWSLGCVFLEMKQRVAPLRADTEIQQLEQVYQLCGYPTNPALLEKYQQYADWKKYESISKPSSSSFIPRLRSRYSSFSEYELNFAEKLLDIDPAKRITANDALNDDYFWHVRTLLPSELKSFDSVLAESVTEHLVQKKHRDDKEKLKEGEKGAAIQQGDRAKDGHRRDHRDHHRNPSKFDGRGGLPPRVSTKAGAGSSKYKVIANPSSAAAAPVASAAVTATTAAATTATTTAIPHSSEESSQPSKADGSEKSAEIR